MKTRIISAIVMIAIALPIIYFGNTIYKLTIGILALLAFKEVLALKKAHQEIPTIPTIFALVLCLIMVYFDFNSLRYSFSSLLIIISLLLLIPTLFYKNEEYKTSDAFYLIGWIIFLGMAFNSFIAIRNHGMRLFFYLVFIPIITDTFAMLVGSKFGKHKMCPKISPKKTMEGFGGGMIMGTIVPCIVYYAFFKTISLKIILMTVILSTIGQIGDLIFSKIKRENEIKDYSDLIPGHGGILDRLDSTSIIFMTYILIQAILF